MVQLFVRLETICRALRAQLGRTVHYISDLYFGLPANEQCGDNRLASTSSMSLLTNDHFVLLKFYDIWHIVWFAKGHESTITKDLPAKPNVRRPWTEMPCWSSMILEWCENPCHFSKFMQHPPFWKLTHFPIKVFNLSPEQKALDQITQDVFESLEMVWYELLRHWFGT